MRRVHSFRASFGISLSESTMNKPSHVLPLFSTRATATVSVALVLLILGLAAMMGCAGHRVATSLRENMGFVMVLTDDATPAQIRDMKLRLLTQPWAAHVTVVTANEVLQRWQKMVGDDEDILKLSGVNPFSPEIEVRVHAAYARPDSLAHITAPLEMAPFVSEIKVHDEMVERVNDTLSQLTVVLAVIAAALLVISVVLIFNTVRLAVYARRFTIYTMKLVGATRGFIRRPFLAANAVNGVIAGIISGAILAAIVQYSHQVHDQMRDAVTWGDAWIVIGSLVVLGVIICFFAALCATNKYLSRSYDDMFKK